MALALLLDSPVYWRSLPGMESWIKAATVVKEFRGFRKPVLLTTARAAPIPSPHAAVFAHTAAGLHCALPPHISPAAALRRHLAARNQARWFRVIARKAGERVKLYSRPGNDLTYRFPLALLYHRRGGCGVRE
jgi:hypothetical protein